MKRRGFSFAELLIAMSIFATLVVVALGVLHWALRGSQAQEANTRAAFLAQARMEELFEAGHPAPESGQFPGAQGDYFWTTRVDPDSDGFLNLTVSVTGARGCSLQLFARRRASRRDLLFVNDNALIQTSEDYKDRVVLPGPVSQAFSLAPAGLTLAYVDDHEGKPQIFTRRLDANPAGAMLFEHPQGAQEPAYSPDGKSLAFVTQDNGFSQVFVYDFKTRLFENKSRGEHNDGSPAWTFDSKSLVVCRDGSSIVLLASDKESVLVEESSGWNACPSLSPDGKQLVFMSNRDGNPEIYLKQLATGRTTRLTNDPAYDTRPNFSSDGKRVMFSSNRGEGHVQQIFTMSLDGSGVEMMTNSSTPSEGSWVP